MRISGLTSAATSLECADVSALWFDATCRVEESGDVSPHSKSILWRDKQVRPVCGCARSGFVRPNGTPEISPAQRAGFIGQIKIRPDGTAEIHCPFSVVLSGRDYFLHLHRGRCPRLISNVAPRPFTPTATHGMRSEVFSARPSFWLRCSSGSTAPCRWRGRPPIRGSATEIYIRRW